MLSDETRMDHWELVSAAVDQQLTATEAAKLAELLRSDALYQQELDRFAAIKSLLARAHREQDLPSTFALRLQRGLDSVDQELADSTPAPTAATPFWQRLLRPALAAAAVALTLFVALPALTDRGSAPADSAVVAATPRIEAHQLVIAHREWHDYAIDQPRPEKSLLVLASDLERQLGYEVTPPDLARLNATLKVCSTCSHSVPGVTAAAFVMDRGGAELTLFELHGPACGLPVDGFAPPRADGIAVAADDGAQLALWSDGQRYACLVSDKLPAAELATMLPQALHWAHRQPNPATSPVPVGASVSPDYTVRPL